MNKKHTHRYLKLALTCISIALIVSFCKKEDEQKTNDSLVHSFSFNPDELWMKKDGSGFFEFTIQPPVEANWAIVEKPEWLLLDPESGTLTSGSIQKINVSVSDFSQNSGSSIFWIKFASNKCDTAQTRIRLETGYIYNKINILPEELLLPNHIDDTSFLLNNTGSNAYSFTIEEIPEHITLSQTEGILHPDNPIRINLHANRSDLDSLLNVSSLVVKNSIDQEKSLKITIHKEYEEGLWELPFLIEDAEYSYSMDKIVAIPQDNYLLLVMDPENRTWLEIDLPKQPLCVSVSPDGHYAAVGFDAFCSYVDLVNASIIDTYPITIKSFDIVMGPNSWIYVFPNDEGSYNSGVQNINTISGEVIFYEGYFSNTSMSLNRLHPSGNFIYGRETNISGNSINKYDISNDTIKLLYVKWPSQVWDNFDFLWISKEGDRIFTQGRNVLSSTDDEQTDLQFITTYGDEGGAWGFDDNPAINLFCVLLYTSSAQWNASNMYTFSLDNLQAQDTFALPVFTKPGDNTLYKPDGKFVFINNNGSKAWVIMHAEEDFLNQHSWRIIGFDL